MHESILHLYHCDDCVLLFGVEAHPDIDHSAVVCPLFKDDQYLSGVADSIPVHYEPQVKEPDKNE